MVHYLDLLSDTFQKNWEKPALTDYAVLDGGAGNDYSYGELYRKIEWLRKVFTKAGLLPGDHIAVCGVNSANWAVAYLAIASYQGVSVTILNSQNPEIIVQQVTFADSKALFVDSDIWEQLPDNLPLDYVFSLEDFSVLKGVLIDVPDNVFGPEDVRFVTGDINCLAQICFTSGSTDEPKGVMLSYGNISNNVLVGIEICPISNYENAVSILPLSHTFGLVFELLVHLEHADRVFLLGKHFSFGIMLESFQRVQPRILQTVPMMMEQLYCRFGKNMANVFGQNLYHLFVGGSSLRPELEDTLLLLGIPLTVGYGSTETAPLIASSNLELYLPHSVGQVVSGMEARISDNGEILVRGKNVMLGYYKNPEATRRKIDADGWLHTGDRGWIDKNNNVFVYGRLEQDMIVLPSGENIIPQNIEALLNKIDGVEESLVLERSGRLIALVYQRTASMDKSTLLRTVNLQLPPFSQLADIEFVSEPFQRTGKSDIKRYLYS